MVPVHSSSTCSTGSTNLFLVQAGCITCAAPKVVALLWDARLSGFSGWMACPVFNCCSFSTLQLFFHLFPMKKWIFGDFGVGLWGRHPTPYLTSSNPGVFRGWCQSWQRSALEELILTRADPRSVLFELKPSTPLNLVVFPPKFKFPTCRKRMHHQSLHVRFKLFSRRPRTSLKPIQNSEIWSRTNSNIETKMKPFPKNTNHWKCLTWKMFHCYFRSKAAPSCIIWVTPAEDPSKM